MRMENEWRLQPHSGEQGWLSSIDWEREGRKSPGILWDSFLRLLKMMVSVAFGHNGIVMNGRLCRERIFCRFETKGTECGYVEV